MPTKHFAEHRFLRSAALAAVLLSFATPTMAKLQWGSFKDNGCVEKSGMRVPAVGWPRST